MMKAATGSTKLTTLSKVEERPEDLRPEESLSGN